MVPKENKSQKCCICNRKNGVSISCSCLGCDAYFHPLCGIRSGKAYIQTRKNETIAFCSQHIPDNVDRLKSGYWIDGFEVFQLRYSLERARLINDLLIKREKLKKLLFKAETELFTLKFPALLDKAKGRKSTATINGENIDLSDFSLDGEESIDGSDDEDSIQFVTKSNKEDAMILLEDLTEEVAISMNYIKNDDEVTVPKKLTMKFAGIEIKKKDVEIILAMKKEDKSKLKIFISKCEVMNTQMYIIQISCMKISR